MKKLNIEARFGDSDIVSSKEITYFQDYEKYNYGCFNYWKNWKEI